MATTISSIRDQQVEALRNAAAQAGDDVMWCIATVALEGWSEGVPKAARYEDRFGGGGHDLSAADRKRISRMTQLDALAECVRVISNAEAAAQ